MAWKSCHDEDLEELLRRNPPIDVDAGPPEEESDSDDKDRRDFYFEDEDGNEVHLVLLSTHTVRGQDYAAFGRADEMEDDDVTNLTEVYFFRCEKSLDGSWDFTAMEDDDEVFEEVRAAVIRMHYHEDS